MAGAEETAGSEGIEATEVDGTEGFDKGEDGAVHDIQSVYECSGRILKVTY
jgi:hypothetical protein